MDGSMKKLILTIVSTAFICALSVQASPKAEVMEKNTSTKNMNDDKIKLTLEMCKKKIGIDNYNFMKDIFNDENIVMTKCKEALIK